MTRPNPNQLTLHPARTARTSNFAWISSQTAVAVRRALLLGLAFDTATIHPILAQPANASTHASAGQQASDPTEEIKTLPKLIVTSDTTMPVYAGGQVSTNSRMGLLGEKDFMTTPFSTITYTNTYMTDIQATDIQEVISKTDPAVFISGVSAESLESYSIRGLPFAVADVTVNGLAGMGGYNRNVPEMFERVEVLKEPSALLNGMPPKGSAGGAVNLVTKRAGKTH